MSDDDANNYSRGMSSLGCNYRRPSIGLYDSKLDFALPGGNSRIECCSWNRRLTWITLYRGKSHPLSINPNTDLRGGERKGPQLLWPHSLHRDFLPEFCHLISKSLAIHGKTAAKMTTNSDVYVDLLRHLNFLLNFRSLLVGR